MIEMRGFQRTDRTVAVLLKGQGAVAAPMRRQTRPVMGACAAKSGTRYAAASTMFGKKPLTQKPAAIVEALQKETGQET